jgi:hypothetical protein
MIAFEHPVPETWAVGEKDGKLIEVHRCTKDGYTITLPEFAHQSFQSLSAAFLAFEAYARKDTPPANLPDADLCSLAERWVEELDASDGNYYPLRVIGQKYNAPPCREVFLELVRRVRENE